MTRRLTRGLTADGRFGQKGKGREGGFQGPLGEGEATGGAGIQRREKRIRLGVSMWVVEVDPEVSMSLQWWQEVIQIRHHVIWAGMCVCMYVYVYACTNGRMYTTDGCPGAGWLPCLTRCLSISRDDMNAQQTRSCAVLS